MADQIIRELCSSQKLERDRGFHSFVKHIDSLESEDVNSLEQDVSKLFIEDSSWEKKHGGLMAAKALLTCGKSSDDFAVDMRSQALKYLDNNEFRVRIAAGLFKNNKIIHISICIQWGGVCNFCGNGVIYIRSFLSPSFLSKP